MENKNEIQSAHNWLPTRAVLGLDSSIDKFRDKYKMDFKDFRMDEFLLGSAVGVSSSLMEDKIEYNIRIIDHYGIRNFKVNIPADSETVWMEFEFKGAKKMVWYFKCQVELFEKMYKQWIAERITFFSELASILNRTVYDKGDEFLMMVDTKKKKKIDDAIDELMKDGGVQYGSFGDSDKNENSPISSSFQFEGNIIHLMCVDFLGTDKMLLTKIIK